MEWKEVTLGEIGTIVGGATPATKNTSFYDGNIPWLTPKDLSVNGNKYIFRGERNITEAGFKSCSCKMLPKGSVLFSSRAPIGYVAIAANDMCTNQGFKSVIPNEETDSEFLYYLLKYNKDNIASQGSGTTFAEVSGKTMKDIEVVVPKEKEDQHRIASILSSLDRKIELNNKINADLEEMAQAIFKNWFVDFEPFKDGKFVDSELGMIPEGWKVVTLDDLTSKFGTGLNPRKNFVLGHGNNYYVTIKNMGNNRIYLNDRCDKVDDEALAKINKRSKLQKGDLLFSGIGTIGRVAMVVDDPINWNTSESVFNMHPIDTVSSEFIYLLLLSDKFQQYVQQNAQGGVQQGIRMASLKAFQFAIPNDLKLFDNLVKPIISKVKSNDKENDTLSLLRDALLPRLMSGEIEVPE